MTGQHLVLCEGPDVEGTLRGAYARYLAGRYRQFLTLGSELPTGLSGAHGQVVDLLDRALATDERQLLSCFASPAVSKLLRPPRRKAWRRHQSHAGAQSSSSKLRCRNYR